MGVDKNHTKPQGKSAQELGIVFPGQQCTSTTAHFWNKKGEVDKGSVFQCRYCHNYLWLPHYYEDAIDLGNLMRIYGGTEGYCKYLNKHRAAKILMAKMQDLMRLEVETNDAVEFAKLVGKILNKKNYDKEERKENGKGT